MSSPREWRWILLAIDPVLRSEVLVYEQRLLQDPSDDLFLGPPAHGSGFGSIESLSRQIPDSPQPPGGFFSSLLALLLTPFSP